jgi:hypothetical protein
MGPLTESSARSLKQVSEREIRWWFLTGLPQCRKQCRTKPFGIMTSGNEANTSRPLTHKLKLGTIVGPNAI